MGSDPDLLITHAEDGAAVARDVLTKGLDARGTSGGAGGRFIFTMSLGKRIQRYSDDYSQKNL